MVTDDSTASGKANATKPIDVEKNPLHLGLGATAVVEPTFTGLPEWDEEYSKRHVDDDAEGRLVSMHTCTKSWNSWKRHPHRHEVVLVTSGSITLVQEVEGKNIETTLTAGQASINPPGVWHTANVESKCTILFITAGKGTENRPRS